MLAYSFDMYNNANAVERENVSFQKTDFIHKKNPVSEIPKQDFL
jgi:hypothetical protein